MKKIFLSILSLCSLSVIGQSDNITTQLYDTYDNFKESSIGSRRIKRTDIQPLIDKLSTNNKFKVATVGKSIGGKDLSLISIGTGETDVFLWSQMHGDEPTATQAIFDILNFFDSADFEKEKEAILANLTVHFLPMLNPDGAELYQRRNLLKVHIIMLNAPKSQLQYRIWLLHIIMKRKSIKLVVTP